MTRHRTVIVGGGHAGGWSAITLRQADPAREIIVIGDEAHPPYERPPLSKAVLSGKAEPASAYLRPAEFYAANDIQLIPGMRVEAIDRTAGAVRAGKQSIPYDSLILATGARPRLLPMAGGNYLRGIDDALELGPQLKAGARVVIIGAGFIGLEVAAVAVTAGCAVTVVDLAMQVLARVVAPEVGAVIADMHRNQGVAFRFGVGITAMEAGQVVLADGTRLAADVIVVGVGAVPNVELAAEAGLAIANGIVVDEFGRSSDPAIYAVGDVAFHFNPLLGRSLRLESWQNAQNQAVAVAKVVAGGSSPYAEVPWFWTDQYDANLQLVGVPERWDRLVWRGFWAAERFTVFYMHDGRVVAGNTLNQGRDMRFVKQLIGRSPDPARLADPTVALQEIVREG